MGDAHCQTPRPEELPSDPPGFEEVSHRDHVQDLQRPSHKAPAWKPKISLGGGAESF